MVGHLWPTTGIELKPLGDSFMSEARALANMIGNGVATVVMARWEGELDRTRLAAVLDGWLSRDEAGIPLDETAEDLGALAPNPCPRPRPA